MSKALIETAVTGEPVLPDTDLDHLQGRRGPGASRAVSRAQHTLSFMAQLALPPLVVFVVLVGLWQACVSAGLISAAIVSEPGQVARLLVQTLGGTQLFGASIWVDLRTTMEGVVLGYVLGAVAGCVIGYVLGRVQFIADIFQPYIQALAAVPKIALVPLFIVMFGIGVTTEMVNAAIMVFIIVVFSTFSGVMAVNQELVDLARIMGAKRVTVAGRVIVPAVLPSVFVGLRAGVSFAFVGAITTEFIAARSGLGWMMERATEGYDTTALFVGLVYVIVLVWLLAELVGLAEHRALRWQRAREGD